MTLNITRKFCRYYTIGIFLILSNKPMELSELFVSLI